MDPYIIFVIISISFYCYCYYCCSRNDPSRYIIRELSNNSFHSSHSDATETCTTCTDISSNNDNV